MRRALATGFLLSFALRAFSQESPTEPVLPTVEELQAKITAAEASTTFDGTTKSRILEIYKQSRDARVRIQDFQAKIDEYDASIVDAPQRLELLQTNLAEPPSDRLVEVSPDTTVAQLNQMLSLEEAELTRLRTTLVQLEGEPARRSERRRVIPESMATARARLQEIEGQLTSVSSADESAELAEARRENLLIRQTSPTCEIAAYEKELQNYDIRRPLMTLGIADGSREVARQEKYVTELRAVVNVRREQEAQAASEQAQEGLRAAAALSPRLRTLVEDLAKENAALTDKWTGPDGLLQGVASAEREKEVVAHSLATLRSEFDRIKEKVDLSGSGEVVGLLLRQQEERLPSVRSYRRKVREHEDTIAFIQIEQIELRERLRQIVDPKAELEQILEGADSTVGEAQLAEATGVLEELLEARQQNIEGLLNEYDSYTGALISLKLEETALIAQTEEFQEYITQRVLFIRSGSLPGLQTIRDGGVAALWLFGLEAWRESIEALWSDIGGLPILYLLAILVAVSLASFRRRFRKLLEAQSVFARKSSCTDMAPTVKVIGLTLYLALPIPLLLGFLGWRLSIPMYGGDFARCVGYGLLVAAPLSALMELVQKVMRPCGIAISHFNWPENPTKKIRRHLRWLYPLIVSAVFVAWTVEASGDEAAKESLGRLSFFVAMVALLVFFAQVLCPRGGALSQIVEHVNGLARRRLRFLIQLAAFGIPTALIIVALAGYYYTALRLSARLYITFFLILSVLFIAGVVLRWLQLVKRKLAREQARQRRAALKAQAEATGDVQALVEDESVDLVKVDVQTQRLVRSMAFLAIIVGSWFIWSSMVPALNALDRIEIGSTEVLVADVDPDAGDTEVIGSHAERRPITLRHLAIAVIIVLLTGAAARNIPGVLEIALLQRLQLGGGERYAITTIVRYVLVGVGTVLAFRAIGIGWANVQFLVAALGLGLGFGLQEIFANFISGLILLFERPIRLGDTVTIGGVHGTVSRIRIRATTITDFDKKELVVPNKEFVTGQLINWTLSDSVLRVVIPVGVSYSSDTELVTKTLLRVANECGTVLDSPEPQALFLGFGDNTLNFEIRVFSDTFDNYMLTKHTMHMAIMKVFRELDIEIAFPQRDIHIRSIQDELPVIERKPPLRGESAPAPGE